MKNAGRILSLWFILAVSLANTQRLYAADGTEMSMNGIYGSYSMAREASGTSWQPDSAPHQGIHAMMDDWMVMAHGYVDQVYDHQEGPRGATKNFSESMFMLIGRKPWGPGTLGLRSMFSLDPAMGSFGYPLLLQTGETGDGRTPLFDRQHPHDLFMEMAMAYSVPVADESSVFAYFGYPGEPALGPPVYMHRLSGMDNPEAPISHHWLDSTHVTFGVATFGFVWDRWKIESSIFTGREPNQDRWDVDPPRFDSQSVRLSYNPGKNWALQASYGHLVSPESLEADINQDRITVSAIYNRHFGSNNWQTTFAWGQDRNHPGKVLNAFMLESALNLRGAHTFFARAERVDKDELVQAPDPLAGKASSVNEISLGYVYDFRTFRHAQPGLGGVGSINLLPNDLRPAYGGATPGSFTIFLRVKLA